MRDNRIDPDLLTLDAIERKLIERRLRRFDGDKVQAAASLGICLKTLYNKLRRYRILGGVRNQDSAD